MSVADDLLRRPKGRPLIAGILNITPDSFSDGGRFFSRKDALAHAYSLIDSRADMIDIGGESTRPGSFPVSEEEEIRRVTGIVAELAQTADVPISVDTMKPGVAKASLSAGASMINDVSGLRDEEMIRTVIDHDVPVVIMHMHGRPETLSTDMMSGDANAQIRRFLDERAEYAVSRGVHERNIVVDPGIGFGKTAEQDMSIIRNSGWFSENHPVMIGPSRKKFLPKYYPGMDRDEATAAVSKIAAENGAGLLRVHNVSVTLSGLERD